MIRYQKLGYVALNVSDLDRSARFYDDVVQLQPAGRVNGGPALFRCSNDHQNVALYPSPTPGLKRVAFQVEDAGQLDFAYEYLGQQGLAPQWVREDETEPLGLKRALRFRDPLNGAQLELFDVIAQCDTPFLPRHTKILRLGHALIWVTDLQKSVEFYTKVLNFRVSDQMEGAVAFLRCFPNPYHHSFGVSRGRDGGFNHLNFMTADIDDIGRARNRFIKNDVPIVFGPGRHIPSTSIFLYFLDPDHLTLEYSFGMEEFAEQGAREARTLPATLEVIDTWDGKPDPLFGATGVIER